MSIDVKGTLQQYLVDSGKAIAITPAIGAAFGPAVGSAITQLLSGSLNVGGVSFSLTGSSATATVSGTGSAKPLLDSFTVSAVFTAQQTGVQMAVNASFQSSWAVSNAWSALNEAPFTDLTLSSGSLALLVNPGDSKYSLTVSATASLSGSPVGTGLFIVQYDGKAVGYLGGFIATTGQGGWSPFKNWPVLQSLTLDAEAGAFVSTITQKDLSAFKGLNLPYLPDEIDPGLTFLASLTLGGSLEKLSSVLPDGTTLNLLANAPLKDPLNGASVTASLTIPATNNAFSFTEFILAWKSTSATSGSISLTVGATFNISSSEKVILTADGTFTYGTSPSLSLDLTVSGSGAWTHPFGIQNLTILSFSIGISLSDEGVDLALAGSIEIGTAPGPQVVLTLGGGIEDFEVPSFIAASLSAPDKDKAVTLAQLIDAFIPSLNMDQYPLLNQISFKDLEFLAVAAPVEVGGKSYQPGVGASGEINFFGYELDFAFSLTTSPAVAVKAKGSISYNGGPIVISGGGIEWLRLEAASDPTKGPSACIDTSASGFCKSTGNGDAYFTIDAKLQMLGIIGVSVLAQATKDSFEFDVALAASSVFSEHLHCLFDPSNGAFAASSVMNFTPPDLTLGPWGPIPQFTIPTPKISLCLALGTTAPSAPPCDDGWMPAPGPYFHFHLAFSWGPIDFNLTFDLDMAAVTSVFSDFSKFLLDFLLKNAATVLGAILEAGIEAAAKLLYQIGMAFYDVVKALAGYFEKAIEEVADLVRDVWNELEKLCSVIVGDGAMSSSSSVRMLAAAPGAAPVVAVTTREGWELVLADLASAPGGGHELLTHYYLHREELDRGCAGGRLQEVLARHPSQPGIANERLVPLAIDLLQTTASGGNEDFRASAAKAVQLLQPHRDRTYPELLQALGR